MSAAAALPTAAARQRRTEGRGMNVIEASGLGKRYGSTGRCASARWRSPPGTWPRWSARTAPGKTTLLNLAVGLAAPTAGAVTCSAAGRRIAGRAGRHRVRRPGHAALQEPVGRGHAAPDPQPEPALRPGLRRGPAGRARHPAEAKAGKLSGGQQAQLALTLALARRPRLLVLDEPMAMLDPLARHDFMATVMTAVADDGVSVLLSSHVLAELERVADYLILLSRGQGAGGRRGRRPARQPPRADRPGRRGRRTPSTAVVHARRAAAQAHLLVRASGRTSDPVPPGWEAHPVGLEELALAYLREPGAAALPGPARERRTRRR
jgi:ABC-2 type transport system ATP-binding protein